MKINANGLLTFCLFITGLLVLIIFILPVIFVNSSLYLSSNELQNTPWSNISVLIDKARSLGNLGNYTEAIKYYDKILRIDPNNMDALTGLGTISYNLGNHTGSINYFNKILIDNSTSKNVLFDKGVALYGLGDYNGSVKYFNKALKWYAFIK